MSATSQNPIFPNSLPPESASSESASPDAGSPKSGDPPSTVQESSPASPPAQPISRARQIFLGVNLAVVSLVLGKALLDPTVGQPRPFVLPETVELNQWELTNNEELEPFKLITGESDYSDGGQRYTYTLESNELSQDASATLTIEMRYMIDTNGFIERLLMGHKDFQETLAALRDKEGNTDTAAADVQYQSGIGYSGRFQIEDTTYLSACINPRGETTFFIDQFLHNQSIYDRDPARLFPVLFGRQTWTDQRCLWTHMALSPNVSGAESSIELSRDMQSLLDETWAEWHSIWQPQFPQR